MNIPSSLQRACHRLATIACASLPVLVGGLSLPGTASAHDTEVFFSLEGEFDTKPNVLFLLDTSATMWTEESASELTYDPNGDYGGDCEKDRYYVVWGGGQDPLTSGCGALPKYTLNDIYCTDVTSALGAGGRTVFNASLTVSQSRNGGSTWQVPSQSQAGWLSCQGQNGGTGPAKYTTKGKNVNAVNAGFTFYRGSWINYQRLPGTAMKYRVDIVREVLAQAVAATPGINVGLARGATDSQLSRDPESPVYDAPFCKLIANPDESTGTGNGGMIVYPVTNMSGPGYQGDNNPDGFVGETGLQQLLYELGVKVTATGSGEDIAYIPTALPWEVDTTIDPPDRRIVAGNPCAIPLFTPNARTPLGLTYYEAYLYFSQQLMTYGDQSDIGPGFDYESVQSSRLEVGGKRYKSPILPENCGATNYIIILSDGTTEKDNENDQAIGSLVYGSGKKCDVETYEGNPVFPPDQGASDCIDDLAAYMQTSDIAPPDGKQTIITHTIGFALGDNTSQEEIQARVILSETAARGGGNFYEADNAANLFGAITNIFREILTRNTSFTSPAVAVNAFNRTQNLNDLYVSLFRPDFAYRWNGNVKKYKLEGGFDPLCTQRVEGGTNFCIVGLGPNADGTGGDLAVDGSGFFYDTPTRKAHSFWSATADGADIALGGAASNLPWWAERKVYTNQDGWQGVNLTLPRNRLTWLQSDGNMAPDQLKQLLGVRATDTLTPSNPDDLIDWLLGKDLISGESRYDMGDPLHTKPVAVVYGGTIEEPDLWLFSLTNDGFLHAIDPDTGIEQWAFVPYDMLGRTRDLYLNGSIQPDERTYGLDGSIRLVRIDRNLNGIIEKADGDRVLLYFGQRRGGSNYYAVDVTDPNNPVLMWEIGSSDLPGVGQSWSTPAPALVRIGTESHLALIFGGGYDPDHDIQPYLGGSQRGARIFMVDALTGARLWFAGGNGSGANLVLANMAHSIPGDVRVVDVSGDGYADRIYAADLGGRVWRFDIFNGQPLAATGSEPRFVEGGVLADMLMQGGSRNTSNPLRFFYSPDPALVTLEGTTFINVAIGSGHRELPVTDAPPNPYTDNWFFSVRDQNVFRQLKSDQYRADCTNVTTACQQTVTFDDLVDLTDVVDPIQASAAVPLLDCPAEGCDPTQAPTYIQGWKIAMLEPGEKVLSESRTFQGEVFFTTYTPTNRGLANSGCATAVGKNRLYVVSALNATATRDLNNEAGVERSRELGQQFTIAPEVVFIFPSTEGPTDECIGEECRPNPICLVGLESCGPGFINAPIRTFWEQRGVE